MCSDSTFAAARKFALPPRVPNLRPSTCAAPPLRDISTRVWSTSYLSRRSARFALENAVAPRITPLMNDRSYLNTQSRLSNDPLVHQAIYGLPPSQADNPIEYAQFQTITPHVPPQGLMLGSPADQSPMPSLRVPASQRLVVDSAKLARLDDLLRELKDGGHRVLLYFQMTRMMDLAEEYLIYRQYKYLRLDGSSPIDQRRDMVTAWQTKWVQRGRGRRA
jgi:DNA helicase INO80